jgi:hypothetical protein
MAAHENPRTTKLYDRTKERLTQQEGRGSDFSHEPPASRNPELLNHVEDALLGTNAVDGQNIIALLRTSMKHPGQHRFLLLKRTIKARTSIKSQPADVACLGKEFFPQ